MTPAIILALSIGSGLGCHFLAKRRGADAVRRGVLGLLFGPLAIPFAAWSRRR